MWKIPFRRRHTYSDRPGESPPRLSVGIGRGATPELVVEAVVDTGSALTIFDGSYLEQLGFDRDQVFDVDNPAFRIFASANGGTTQARAFQITLHIFDDRHDAVVYGSLHGYNLQRNLLGIDLIRRYVFGIHDEAGHLYLTNLATDDCQIVAS